MTNIPKEIILVGNGFSVEAEQTKLFETLKNKCWFGMNTRFEVNTKLNLSIPTALTIVDGSFWTDNHTILKNAPLILTVPRRQQKSNSYDNMMMFKSKAEKYDPTLQTGVYTTLNNCAFGISLANFLLKFTGKLWLLGMDWGTLQTNRDKKNRVITHANQELLRHRGLGQTSFTTPQRAHLIFDKLKNNGCEIINTGLGSKLPDNIFPKISYELFYNSLSNENFEQEELRTWIRQELSSVCFWQK
jgi:NADPH-dependent 7-cyano-7-deazaguanine reductase QueF-like protein